MMTKEVRDEKAKKAKVMKNAGYYVTEIARVLGLPESTIRKMLEE